MSFNDLEKIRNIKCLRKWQFAALLGLIPKSRVKTSLIQYCASAYNRLRTGESKITVFIVANAERIKGMSADEIVKELKQIAT